MRRSRSTENAAIVEARAMAAAAGKSLGDFIADEIVAGLEADARKDSSGLPRLVFFDGDDLLPDLKPAPVSPPPRAAQRKRRNRGN